MPSSDGGILTEYLEHPVFEIDNSLIETCRKLDINPADYLHAVLAALPTMMSKQAPDWTPARWLVRQQKSDV